MTEIRETLRFTSNDLEEMNRVMGRLQDRLDELEGRRGDPSFYSDVNFNLKNLQNVANINQQQTTTDQATIATGNITDATIGNATFSNPINLPITDTVNPDYPTTSFLPNSGDFAIWRRTFGLLIALFLVINCDGDIYYAPLTKAP